jgi:hypothetical protein
VELSAPTCIGIGAMVIALFLAAVGAIIDYHQSGPNWPNSRSNALLPTIPYGVEAAVLFTIGLLLAPHGPLAALPWWLCVVAGVVGVISIGLITLAGRVGRARR